MVSVSCCTVSQVTREGITYLLTRLVGIPAPRAAVRGLLGSMLVSLSLPPCCDVDTIDLIEDSEYVLLLVVLGVPPRLRGLLPSAR